MGRQTETEPQLKTFSGKTVKFTIDGLDPDCRPVEGDTSSYFRFNFDELSSTFLIQEGTSFSRSLPSSYLKQFEEVWLALKLFEISNSADYHRSSED